MKAIDKLPSLSDLTLADKDTIKALQDGYNKMTAYQQGYISDEYVKKLQKYVQRMAELVEMAGGDDKDEGEGDGEGEGDKTEGVGDGESGGDQAGGTGGSENSGTAQGA